MELRGGLELQPVRAIPMRVPGALSRLQGDRSAFSRWGGAFCWSDDRFLVFVFAFAGRGAVFFWSDLGCFGEKNTNKKKTSPSGPGGLLEFSHFWGLGQL